MSDIVAATKDKDKKKDSAAVDEKDLLAIDLTELKNLDFPVLEKLLDKYKSLSAAKKKGRKDIKQFTDKEKEEIRSIYANIIAIAHELSMRAEDTDLRKKYAEVEKQAIDKAVIFGSAVSSRRAVKTFDDVAGCEEEKKLIQSFVFFAKHPEVIEHYGMEGGLGLLLYGAPGTGKTLFAEAIANELGYLLYTITPSDIFKSHVGESEASARKLFEEINSLDVGVVLFIDECESIFSKRKADTQDYKVAVTNEILQGMNGFGGKGQRNNRIIVAATNRPMDIDEAYLRFKRFTYQVHIKPPEKEAMRAMIEGRFKMYQKDKNGKYLRDEKGEKVLNPRRIRLEGITIDEMLEMLTNKTDENGNIHYYSGADICGALEEMCRLVIKQIENLIPKDSKPLTDAEFLPITRKIVEKVLSSRVGSITPDMLKEYEDFERRNKAA